MRNAVYNEIGYLGHNIARQNVKLKESHIVNIKDLSKSDQEKIKKEISDTFPYDKSLQLELTLKKLNNKSTPSDLPEKFAYVRITSGVDIEYTKDNDNSMYKIGFSSSVTVYNIKDKAAFLAEMRKGHDLSDLNEQHLFLQELFTNGAISCGDGFTCAKKVSFSTVEYSKFEFYLGCTAIALVAALGIGVVLYMKPSILESILNKTASSGLSL